MTFYLFREPKSWPEWLGQAFKAEQICLKRGMSKEMAHHVMAFEDPKRILEFIREFSNESERYLDNFQSSYNYNEGSAQTFPTARRR